LYEVFGRFGEVLDAVVLKDRETGRSRGFGFVTFGSADEANSALSLDGQDHDGRMMKVNIAEERRR
jgi:RNA recognition motif-containing protein